MKLTKMINGVPVKIEITEEDFKNLSIQRKKEASPNQVVFLLSMPKNNSANGRWTGDEKVHAIILPKSKVGSVEGIMNMAPYNYDFGDGWVAQIDVKFLNAYEAAEIKKNNDGFCGYDWMVKSIIDNGTITR